MALGGSSLREFPSPGGAAGEAGRPVAILLWETRAASESSLSESTINTLFPLLERAEAGVGAMANGTAAMGGGEADGGGIGRAATVGTSEATTSPPSLVDFAFFKNLARASRLEEVITEPATAENSSVPSRIRTLTKSRSKSTTGRSKVNARRRLGVKMLRGSVAKARRRQGKASPGAGVAKAKRSPDGGIASLGRRQIKQC